jgi:hypothetical protein
MGKPADSNAGGFAAEAQTADDADTDALLAAAAPIEVARCFSLPDFDHSHEFNDWRARSSIGARGPPIA